ncbi:MAG: hypothetical protein DWQ49_15460 [Bacteroidetes bacterium]|nr:MAG: hypothetical protein DWQ49_15460 [Bacteroidota bacterium]
MSIQDTKERIFVNGQIYSRPIGGGPVHGPDTRRFTPDPNPYDVPPEPRGYGQGTVDDLLFRPGIDKFEIENPVLRPGDTYEVLPLDYLNQYLNNRGITEQNQEVMGSKEQVFPRYANPEDGTLNNEEMARVDPIDKLLLKSLRKGEIGDPNNPRIRKAIIDLERKIYNDGRASSMDGALVAADPSFAIPREVSPQEVNQINRRVISDYDKKKEMLRRGLLAPLLRGV